MNQTQNKRLEEIEFDPEISIKKIKFALTMFIQRAYMRDVNGLCQYDELQRRKYIQTQKTYEHLTGLFFEK